MYCRTHSLLNIWGNGSKLLWSDDLNGSGDFRYDSCPTGCESTQHGASCTEKLQILTVKCVTDLDKWTAQGKGDRSLFVASNQCIPIKNTVGWSAVVFCACEIIQLFSVVFCVVRGVCKFEFGLVISTKKGNSVTERLMFFIESIFFPLSVVLGVTALCPSWAGGLLSLQSRTLPLQCWAPLNQVSILTCSNLKWNQLLATSHRAAHTVHKARSPSHFPPHCTSQRLWGLCN